MHSLKLLQAPLEHWHPGIRSFINEDLIPSTLVCCKNWLSTVRLFPFKGESMKWRQFNDFLEKSVAETK